MKKIVYAKNGMWKFYFDLRLGICYYEPKAFTPMILFEEGMEDFDVTCNDKGDIFLLCQDSTGNLFLFWHNLHKWSKQCILESKSVVPYNKNFSLIFTDEILNAFYTIKHGGSELLIHHILNDEGQPFVTDSSDKHIIYNVIKDSSNNIYCLYEKEGLGYKKYDYLSKSWQNFINICEIKGELCGINSIIKDGNLHGVLNIRERTKYSVNYFNLCDSYEILSEIQSDPAPSILYYDKFYILFKLGGRIIQSVSDNPKEGFSKPSYYFPGSFSPNYLFKVCGFSDTDKNGIFPSFMYGTEIRADKFEPAIIKELENN